MALRFSVLRVSPFQNGLRRSSHTEGEVHDRLPIYVATADRPEISGKWLMPPSDGVCGWGSIRTWFPTPRSWGRRERASALLAGGCGSGVVDRGRRILLSSAVAEHAGRHGRTGLWARPAAPVKSPTNCRIASPTCSFSSCCAQQSLLSAQWLLGGDPLLPVAYVGTLGQVVGVQGEFSGWMAKPWRMLRFTLAHGSRLGRFGGETARFTTVA